MKGVQKIVCDRQWGNGAGGMFHSKNSLFYASENSGNDRTGAAMPPRLCACAWDSVPHLYRICTGIPFLACCVMPFYSLRLLIPITALGADRGNRGRVCCFFMLSEMPGIFLFPIKGKNVVLMAAHGHRVLCADIEAPPT